MLHSFTGRDVGIKVGSNYFSLCNRYGLVFIFSILQGPVLCIYGRTYQLQRAIRLHVMKHIRFGVTLSAAENKFFLASRQDDKTKFS